MVKVKIVDRMLVYIILNSTLSRMKKSITQESDYGCGVACFAFATSMSYKEAVTFMGKEYSVKNGWRPSDLVLSLKRYGYNYKNSYVRKIPSYKYPNGTIVLIERSTNYPVGHYLVLERDKWMDPWINLPTDNDIAHARSGFRKQLPGHPMYALVPKYELQVNL